MNITSMVVATWLTKASHLHTSTSNFSITKLKNRLKAKDKKYLNSCTLPLMLDSTKTRNLFKTNPKQKVKVPDTNKAAI